MRFFTYLFSNSESARMALGNGSATANGGVNAEKAPVVNGTNMETLPRTGKQVRNNFIFLFFSFIPIWIPHPLDFDIYMRVVLQDIIFPFTFFFLVVLLKLY